MSGVTVDIPVDFWLPKPFLKINPSTGEIGTGYASLAVFSVYTIIGVALLVFEFLRSRNQQKDSTQSSHIIFFLVSSVAYFIFRISSIAVSLNVQRLQPNMMAVMVLECFGNILCLLSFTIVASSWTTVLGQPGQLSVHMKRLSSVLFIVWGVIACALFGIMVWFCASLPKNFGVSAHDDVFFLNGGTYVLVPPTVNNSLVKPQASIIYANRNLHDSYMSEKGIYAVYGFLLGAVFLVMSAAIIIMVKRIRSALSSTKDPRDFVRMVSKILLVSGGVAICFSIIFIFTILELATHRHAVRSEYYITNYLAAELVAFGILLFHFWSAELRAYEREKTQATLTGSGGSGGSKRSGGGGYSQGQNNTRTATSGTSGTTSADSDVYAVDL